MAINKFNAKNGLSIGATQIDLIDNNGNATFLTLGVTGSASVSGNVVITGNTLIGTNVSNGYKLEVLGSFAATTKSFLINHPTKPNMKLRYGSLEGPENGVYIRGRLTNSNIISLPEYWTELVDEDSITVNLTPIGKQELYVENVTKNKVFVRGNKMVDCYYLILAERKDVLKIQVEIPDDSRN